MHNPHQPKGFIGIFAHHKVAANLLMLLMICAGIYSLAQLNTQFFPDYELDFITVNVARTGASAEDMEQSITIPLEQELRSTDRLKEMTSVSQLGSSFIVLELQEGTDVGQALDQVKEKISLVRNLPSDAEEPEVSKVEDYEPVAHLLVTGTEHLDELRPLARKVERQLLDRGIAKITFEGMPEEEIAIQIPTLRLKELGISLNQVANLIADSSQDIPAGTIGKNESARQLRAIEQARSVHDFEQLPLLVDDTGRLVRLGDVAEITKRPKTGESLIYYQGKPAIDLTLLRVGEADSLEAAKILEDWVAEAKQVFPSNIQLIIYEQNWQLIIERITLLLKNGSGGMLLIIGILFLFLNGRVATWVAVGIPVSFLATLTIILLLGGSINMISLFALIMALGIIVDDAIVVAEDAMTHYQYGEDALKAAEGGAKRMLAPVMSSSLTTIAAFLPLMLISGIIGKFLITIPTVVICVILASLIESFLILPGHLNHSFQKMHHREPTPLRKKLDDYFSHFRDQVFRPLVTRAIRNRAATISLGVAALVLMLGVMMSGRLSFTFFPSPEGTVVFANAQFTSGTPPTQVKEFLAYVEQQLNATNAEFKKEENQDIIQASILRLNTLVSYEATGPARGENVGSIYVELISPDQRATRNKAFIEAWRKRVKLPAGIESFTISEAISGPPGKDIDMELTNGTPAVLKAAALELAQKLNTYVGVSNIADDLPYGQEQLIFSLTPEGEALGFTIRNISDQIRAAFNSQLVQIFNEADDEVEVRIMLPDNERNRLSSFNQLIVVTPDGEPVALSNVVSIRKRRGMDILRHTDGKLTIHVTAKVDSQQNNSNVIIADLKKETIASVEKKYGINIKFKGKAKEQAETLSDMLKGLMLAVVLVYIILAWVFASYTWPLAVMAIIPFGLAGALGGHWFMGLDLTILSLFGLFGLSGIVINDSIVLVTFYKHLRETGMTVQDAIIEATCQRLRAILLTSLTTIAGLTPLLFETSLQAQFLIPMACSISFGLAFATFLILFMMPSILSYIEQFNHWRENKRSECLA